MRAKTVLCVVAICAAAACSQPQRCDTFERDDGVRIDVCTDADYEGDLEDLIGL